MSISTKNGAFSSAATPLPHILLSHAPATNGFESEMDAELYKHTNEYSHFSLQVFRFRQKHSQESKAKSLVAWLSLECFPSSLGFS